MRTRREVFIFVSKPPRAATKVVLPSLGVDEVPATTLGSRSRLAQLMAVKTARTASAAGDVVFSRMLVTTLERAAAVPLTSGTIARTLTPVSRLGWHELNFGQTQAPGSPLFPSDEAFAEAWNGPERVLAVVHRDLLKDFSAPPLADRKAIVLALSPSGKHALLANR